MKRVIVALLGMVSACCAPRARPDSRVACTLESRACEDRCLAGAADACVALAHLHLESAFEIALGKRADDHRDHSDSARRLFQHACDLRNGAGCLGVANSLATSGDSVSAATIYAQACSLGSAGGCASLADAYSRGLGVEVNDAESERLRARAAQLYKRGCEDGNADDCHSLALMQDPPERAASFLSACRAGRIADCLEASETYRALGKIEAADAARQEACRRGDKASCLPSD